MELKMMSSNLKKQKADKKLAAQNKSDLILYKLMISFLIAVVGITGMLTVGKSLRSEAFFRTNILPALLIVSGAAMVAAIVFFALQRSRHIDESAKIITSANILGTAIAFFGSLLYYEVSFDAAQVVILMICAVVLYFVFNIYRKDFFLCSIAAAAGINLIRMATTSMSTIFGSLISIAAKVFGILIPIVLIVFVVFLHTNKGIFMKKKLIDKGDHIYPTILVSAISLAGTILTVVAPAIAIYSIIVLLVAYLAIAVAYTIRMM